MASKKRVLVINPNTTQAMTSGLKPLIASLKHDMIDYIFYTAPTGVPSINNENDAQASTEACLADEQFREALHDQDGFLVCCYSQHPLVPALRKELAHRDLHGRAVTGIFEASIAACLQSIDVNEKFGIVSTGSQWEQILGEAVRNLLGASASSRYAGTETTGLNADELHRTAKEEVDRRMKAATKRLLAKGATAICLGCAGMAGMDVTVHEACIEQLGEAAGGRVKIVDGVVAGAIYSTRA